MFDMSLDEYHAARFDLISSRRQWVPEFYEAKAVNNGKANLAEFRELEKRAKAAGVWQKGMKKAELEKALVTVSN